MIKASSVLGLDQEVGVLHVYKEDLERISASFDVDEYGGESIPLLTDIEELGGRFFKWQWIDMVNLPRANCLG